MHQQVLQLSEIPFEDPNIFLGNVAEATDYKRLISTNTRVVKADGSLLAIFVRCAITRLEGMRMHNAIKDHVRFTFPTNTRVLGFFDRSPRYPFCRPTAYSNQNFLAYEKSLPAIKQASDTFEREAPEAHKAQRLAIDRTHKDFYIPGTVFTTVTLRAEPSRGYHRSAGDLPGSLSVMTSYRSGAYTGGHFIFPAHRLAFKMNSLDVLIFDPHEIHAHTPMEDESHDASQITCTHYYREHMDECGSSKQEGKRARGKDRSEDLR